MSAENTFRYNRTKQFLGRIHNLKSKGEDFVQKIAKTLNQLYPGHFKELKNAGTRLMLEFFGLTFLVRVEIEIKEDQAGRLRTYLCDDASPSRLQKLDFEYVFDDLGNVDTTKTISEAAAEFGPELIEHLHSKKIALLP
jgi:hypothetical protein